MSTPKRIHITDAGKKQGFQISVGEIQFRARSLVIESAPCQPGTILWMSQVSLGVDGDTAVKDIVGFYDDKEGEKVGEELMGYMIERDQELRGN